MSPLDLIRSKDGSMSVTKLAVVIAHVQAAFFFAHLQWGKPFNELLWVVYLGVTVGHAGYDKTAAMINAFKQRQLGEPKP